MTIEGLLPQQVLDFGRVIGMLNYYTDEEPQEGVEIHQHKNINGFYEDYIDVFFTKDGSHIRIGVVRKGPGLGGCGPTEEPSLPVPTVRKRKKVRM